MEPDTKSLPAIAESRHFRRFLFLGGAILALLSTVAPQLAQTADNMDWPHWRGPEHNGISRETGLIDKWTDDKEIWKKPEYGTRSTPIVMNGKLYVLCRHEPDTSRECEKVVCLDANTGDVQWENRFNVFLSDVPCERVGWSCCTGDPETGDVYALGVCGYFQCINGATGETIWSRSLSEEFGLLSTYGGRTNVPVVFENMVLISAVMTNWGENAVPAHRFLAMDKRTGEVIWYNGTRLRPEDTTYSTPFLTVLGGEAAMVFGSGDGAVHAFQPRTGKPLWSYPFSIRGLDVSPLVVGDTIYTGHSEENRDDNSRGAMCAINGALRGDLVANHGEIWRTKNLMVGKSSPTFVDGRLYAVDDNNTLYVVDAATGKLVGKKVLLLGTYTRASPLYADGKLYVCTRSAWHVFKPTKDGVKLIQKKRLASGVEMDGSPIVSHGRIYLPTSDCLYCLGNKDVAPSVPDEQPALPQETPAGAESKPAWLQIIPAESLIRSGEKLQFRGKLYNDRGQFLSEAENVEYTLTGAGTIDASGAFASDVKSGHAAVLLTAKVGELTAKARVRVVPPLPWKFDFSNGQVPITWIGARYRHITLDSELLATLREKEPRAAELYIYLTTSFVNGATEKVDFNDRTPRRLWTDFLRYFDLDEAQAARTLEGCQAEFDAALETLTKEGVIKSHAWSSKGPGDIGLVVEKGDRKPTAGQPMMVKIRTIPKGTRSQSWMGHPDLHDFTVQADVMGTKHDGKVPDIGLIGQRYTLDMMGEKQQLQIRSWTPQWMTRFSKNEPFAWKPYVWYTIKFQVAAADGKAILKGKVWPRTEREPKTWMIEAVDEAPNTVGSPGLFGNANDAEIFLDNISVTAN